MLRYQRITTEITLAILWMAFFTSPFTVGAQNISIDQYDSIYRYGALENKANYLHITDEPEEKLPEDIILREKKNNGEN